MPFVRRLGPFRETNNDFPSAEMQPLYPSVDADSFKSGTASLQGVFGAIFGVIAGTTECHLSSLFDELSFVSIH